ncbi:hypothetical protein [Alkalicoccus urumqiensis]|uniref:Uncharacterized protein n=1 Tax=Alkalicoccus urumqiensis TaxID=1548213 RepID=A0A2P6ME55_ALKUR|nr:hypothetical protein [Alkalicoccus urumqiensis]PRO64546.1 hypothetical protein C6I21_13675 [Alkalicoccus urumqiensis]
MDFQKNDWGALKAPVQVETLTKSYSLRICHRQSGFRSDISMTEAYRRSREITNPHQWLWKTALEGLERMNSGTAYVFSGSVPLSGIQHAEAKPIHEAMAYEAS